MVVAPNKVLVTIKTTDGQEYRYTRQMDERVFDEYDDEYFEIKDEATLRRFYTANVISVTVDRIYSHGES